MYLMVDTGELQEFKNIIGIEFQDREDDNYARPLCFDKFFKKCKSKLNLIYKNDFKKEKVFNDLLITICESQVKEEFLEKANFIARQEESDDNDLSIESDFHEV